LGIAGMEAQFGGDSRNGGTVGGDSRNGGTVGDSRNGGTVGETWIECVDDSIKILGPREAMLKSSAVQDWYVGKPSNPRKLGKRTLNQ